jgi:hypothetical protein
MMMMMMVMMMMPPPLMMMCSGALAAAHDRPDSTQRMQERRDDGWKDGTPVRYVNRAVRARASCFAQAALVPCTHAARATRCCVWRRCGRLQASASELSPLRQELSHHYDRMAALQRSIILRDTSVLTAPLQVPYLTAAGSVVTPARSPAVHTSPGPATTSASRAVALATSPVSVSTPHSPPRHGSGASTAGSGASTLGSPSGASRAKPRSKSQSMRVAVPSTRDASPPLHRSPGDAGERGGRGGGIAVGSADTRSEHGSRGSLASHASSVHPPGWARCVLRSASRRSPLTLLLSLNRSPCPPLCCACVVGCLEYGLCFHTLSLSLSLPLSPLAGTVGFVVAAVA